MATKMLLKVIEKKKKKKNKGGVLGGLGYATAKLVTGALDVVEDTADVLIGTTADIIGSTAGLFGAKGVKKDLNEWAKKVHTDDYTDTWNDSLDEWYNPDAAWRTVGDVTGGVGQSLTYLGVSLIPYVGPAMSATMMAGSGAGGGIESAVEKTGKLGAKEYLYGGLSGATEVALESFTGAAGKMATKLAKPAAKGVAKTIGKESVEALAKKGAKSAAKSAARKGFIKTTFSGATGEFIEEAASTYLDAQWQRLTGVDKNARASFKDIAYSGFVGALSGGVLSAGTQGFKNASNLSRGSRIVENNNAEAMVNTAKYISKAFDLKGETSGNRSSEVRERFSESLQQIDKAVDAYEKLSDKTSTKAKLYLGEMQETVAYVETVSKAIETAKPFREALSQDPAVAERYAKTVSMITKKNVTAEDIQNNTPMFGKIGAMDMLGVIKLAGEIVTDKESTYEAKLRLEEQLKNPTVAESNIGADMSNVATEAQNTTAQTAPTQTATPSTKSTLFAKNPTLNAQVKATVEQNTSENTAEIPQISTEAQRVAENASSATTTAETNISGMGNVANAKIGAQNLVKRDIGDIDNDDVSRYNETTLSSNERSRIESEALTWDSSHRNEIRTRPLSNGYTYRYLIDDDGIVHVYSKMKSENIHERNTTYDNSNREGFDNLLEGSGNRQRNNSKSFDSVRNGRKQRKADRNDPGQIQREGTSDRAGSAEDAHEADLHKKSGIKRAISLEEAETQRKESFDALLQEEEAKAKKKAKPKQKAKTAEEIKAEEAAALEADKESHWQAYQKARTEAMLAFGTDGFVFLPAETRENIIRMYMELSGIKEVTAETKKALATIMAARPGLHVFASDKLADNGAWRYVNGERVIVVSRNSGAVTNALLHEITHDLALENSKHYQKLSKAVLANTSDEVRQKVYDAYLMRHLRDTNQIDESATLEEAKKVFQTFTEEQQSYFNDVVTEEITARAVAEKLGQKKFLHEHGKEHRFAIMRAIAHLRKLGASLTQRSDADKYLREIEKNFKAAAFKDNAQAERFMKKLGEWEEKEREESLRRDIANYTEKQYNDFGWARANGVLSAGQNKDYTSKFADAVNGRGKFQKTKNGEFMIPVSNVGTAFEGVNNTIVYAKGTIDNPIITRVLHIDAHDETTLSEIRSNIYAFERNGIRQKAGGIFTLYTPSDVANYEQYERSGSQIVGYNNGLDTNGSRSGRKAQKIKRISFDEEGNVKNVIYRSIDISDRIISTHDERTKWEKGKDFVNTVRSRSAKENASAAKTAGQAAAIKTQIQFTNAQAGIEFHLKQAGLSKEEVEASVNMVRMAARKGTASVTGKQTDINGNIIGDGLQEIMRPIKPTDKEAFRAYLVHKLNMYRAPRGKAVFDDLTAKQSEAEVKRLEKIHPEFKEVSERMSEFDKNELQLAVDARLISQDQADAYHKLNPYYVTIRRLRDTDPSTFKSSAFRIKNFTKQATGGEAMIVDPVETYMDHIVSMERSAYINLLANAIYDTEDGINVVSARDKIPNFDKKLEEEGREGLIGMNYREGIEKKSNTIVFFRDGEALAMEVSDEIMDGFRALQGDTSSYFNSTVGKLNTGAIKLFSKLVTTYNPFFIIRNLVRDFQDAGIYSKHGLLKFAKEYVTNTIREIASNGEYWQEYIANGAFDTSMFDYTLGTKSNRIGLKKAEGNGFKQAATLFENAQLLIEQLPRFTEYMLSRKAGNDVKTSLYYAADVTVNFGRSGKTTKVLGKTLIPFLNPSVQGFSKNVRILGEAVNYKDQQRWKRAVKNLLLSAGLLGIAPIILSNLLYEDDEEYQDLDDNLKANYYLIRYGKGKYIRLPRGRLASAFSGVTNTAMSEDADAGKWLDTTKNILSNTTPVDTAMRTIFSPIYDAKTNTTWYGGQIESQAYDSVEPSKRYDEYTSGIAKWLGKTFNDSPKKIDYVLDQYSGVIGDFLLPLTAEKKKADNIGETLFSSMLTDATYSNKLSKEFYDMYEKANWEEDSLENTLIKKHLNKVKQSVKELNKEIDKINEDSSLSDEEKVKRAKEIRVLINRTYKTAKEDYKLLKEKAKVAESSYKNVYAITEVTKNNYKALGLDKDDIGTYSVVYSVGDEFYSVQTRDTTDEAQEYLESAMERAAFSDFYLDCYGAAAAIEAYAPSFYQKATVAHALGADYENMYRLLCETRYMTSAEKKERVDDYLRTMPYGTNLKYLIKYIFGDTTKKTKRRAAVALKRSDVDDEIKKEWLKKLK